jgi:hypothetical protein
MSIIYKTKTKIEGQPSMSRRADAAKNNRRENSSDRALLAVES